MRDRDCKVVPKPYGHLVILPNVGTAMEIFRQALGMGHDYYSSGIDAYMQELEKKVDHQGKPIKPTDEQRMDIVLKHAGAHMSPEYKEKYRKQFATLGREEGCEITYKIIDDAITNGDPRKIKVVRDTSVKLLDLVYKIMPSLRLSVERDRAEIGDIWDAGLIASDDPMPCWDNRRPQHIKPGVGGDGAYRIVINTDTSFGNSDSTNCILLSAMIYVMQQYADVEIWVQQGWVSYGSGAGGMNGITLFPAFRGSGLHPAQLMFWCGHPMRDGIYSNLINSWMGRQSSGTSSEAEIQCDLYTRNACFSKMPDFDPEASADKQAKQLDAMAKWTATQLASVLIDETQLQ